MERSARQLSYWILRHRLWHSGALARPSPAVAAPPQISSLHYMSTTVPKSGTSAKRLQFHTEYITKFQSFPTLVQLRVEYGPSLGGFRMQHTSSALQSSSGPTEEKKKNEETPKKPSSKIEETVNRIKKLQEEGQAQKKDQMGIVKVKETQVASEQKKTIWVRVKDEIKHYYSGFKLLFLDIKICSKIIWKLMNGNVLTRRENKQLVRTVGDIFRLVPFSVFIIVPFMEFLLPFALKLFPFMLPSTFTTSSERENNMKRTLKAKLEYAKFLQQTLDKMAPSDKSRDSKSARDFVEFYRQVKEQGISVKNREILKFSQLFKDEITLDNMTRSQLVALCRLLELTPFGTDNFLRFQLEMTLRNLKFDDRVIRRDGIENMNVEELQNANKERGMRAIGLSEKQLEKQLGQWLALSLDENIPPSLLLLSRTLFLPETLDPTAQIAATISTLPESAAARTSAEIAAQEGKIRNVTQLEITKEEQRRIEEEALEAAKAKEVEEAAKAKEVEEAAKAKEVEEAAKAKEVEEAAKAKEVEEARKLTEVEEKLEKKADPL